MLPLPSSHCLRLATAETSASNAGDYPDCQYAHRRSCGNRFSAWRHIPRWRHGLCGTFSQREFIIILHDTGLLCFPFRPVERLYIVLHAAFRCENRVSATLDTVKQHFDCTNLIEQLRIIHFELHNFGLSRQFSRLGSLAIGENINSTLRLVAYSWQPTFRATSVTVAPQPYPQSLHVCKLAFGCRYEFKLHLKTQLF